MSGLAMNPILGIFAVALILGVRSTGMCLE